MKDNRSKNVTSICNIDIDSKIELCRRRFCKKDLELFEYYRVDFLKIRNQVVMILAFQHESNARELFNKIKENNK